MPSSRGTFSCGGGTSRTSGSVCADREAQRADTFSAIGRALRNLAVHRPAALADALGDAFPWVEFLLAADRRLFLDELSRVVLAAATFNDYEALSQTGPGVAGRRGPRRPEARSTAPAGGRGGRRAGGLAQSLTWRSANARTAWEKLTADRRHRRGRRAHHRRPHRPLPSDVPHPYELSWLRCGGGVGRGWTAQVGAPGSVLRDLCRRVQRAHPLEHEAIDAANTAAKGLVTTY